MSAIAPWNRLTRAYTSVRMQVESTTTSSRYGRSARSDSALGRSTGETIIGSSACRRTVRWFIPTTAIDKPRDAPSLRLGDPSG